MLKTLKGIVTLNMSTTTESSNNFHAKDPERYRNFEYVNNDRIHLTISMLKTLKGIVTLNMSTMTESGNDFHAKDPERYRNFEYVNNDRIR